MSTTAEVTDQRQLLRRELGLRDLILFNIAAVLGPRWIAAAAHNGTSSVSLWVLAALFFFVPTALVIVELSTRYPHEGGVYAWTKEAFGDFHGFVAGWCYWIYTFFYFPGLLLASVAMSVYIGGPGWAWLGEHRTYLVIAALVLLGIAVTPQHCWPERWEMAAKCRRRFHLHSPVNPGSRGLFSNQRARCGHSDNF